MIAARVTHAARCACGGVTGPTGECERCRAKRIDDGGAVASAQHLHAPAQHRCDSLTVHGQRAAGGARTTAPAPAAPDVVEVARRAAWLRSQLAYEQLAGLVPPSPYPFGDPAAEARIRARMLTTRLFGGPLNMDQVTEIVGAMRDRLAPGLRAVRAAPGDPQCGTRVAYVRGHAPPITLCPGFYRSSPEQRVRTLVHEAAHLSGIGEPNESYCVIYDCETSCGGFHTADSWAHLVHCLSGRQPDRPDR